MRPNAQATSATMRGSGASSRSHSAGPTERMAGTLRLPMRPSARAAAPPTGQGSSSSPSRSLTSSAWPWWPSASMRATISPPRARCSAARPVGAESSASQLLTSGSAPGVHASERATATRTGSSGSVRSSVSGPSASAERSRPSAVATATRSCSEAPASSGTSCAGAARSHSSSWISCKESEASAACSNHQAITSGLPWPAARPARPGPRSLRPWGGSLPSPGTARGWGWRAERWCGRGGRPTAGPARARRA
jgi:hypothetical protein